MTSFDLAEIESWLTLSFDDFTDKVVSEMISRCLGIMGHGELLGVGFAEDRIDLVDLPRLLKRIVAPHFERLKVIRMGIYTYEMSVFNPQQKREFLEMLITEITHMADEIDRLMKQIPDNYVRSNANAVWNVKDNNLVRLRRLLHVCGVYFEQISE